MTEAEESSMATARIELRTAALEEDALTTKPTRRFADQRHSHHRPATNRASGRRKTRGLGGGLGGRGDRRETTSKRGEAVSSASSQRADPSVARCQAVRLESGRHGHRSPVVS